jgi:hypothetical protein
VRQRADEHRGTQSRRHHRTRRAALLSIPAGDEQHRHQHDVDHGDVLIQLRTGAWRRGCHHHPDVAGIATEPGPYVDVLVSTGVDGTGGRTTDSRVDTRRDATVRVTRPVTRPESNARQT